MAESTHSLSSNSPPPSSATTVQTTRSWHLGLFISAVTTVIIALLLVEINTFDAAAYPPDELTKKPIFAAPRVNPHALYGSERIGEGRLSGPEDIVYDPKLGVIYTGCGDGWIKRVSLNDSAVEDWVSTGGRPLGLALGYSGELYVADALKVSFKFTTV